MVAAFAGLRPLVAEDEGRSTSGVSREHRIFTSSGGLLSIGGGKYTTYRSIAEEVADRVCSLLGGSRGRCLTGRIPLPGGATGDFGAFVRRNLAEQVGKVGLPARTVQRFLARYGSRTGALLEMLCAEPDLARPVRAGSSLLALEVAYSCEREFARTPEDVLRRRTSLALGPGRGLPELEAVAELLARRQGRSTVPGTWLTDYRNRYAKL